MNFFFLDNFLKIENTNLKFYNIADILIYNISVSSLLSVDIIDNILQITTKNNDVYKLEFMDNNQLLSAKQIILNIINGSTDYIGVNGKYRELSTYYTLSGFIDTAYSGNNILRLKDKSNISKYLLLMNTIRSTTVQNHILVISMYEKSIPLRFLTHDDAKNAKIVLDDYILNNSDPGGGGGGGVVTNHSQLVLNDGTNPHGTTKSDVGLGNVDNTSDINKPISNATLTALNNKVDKITGKGLSQEDFTTTYKDKLDGIQNGAEVNVQSDWNQTNNTFDDYIKNKPVNLSQFNNDLTFITTETDPIFTASEASNFVTGDKDKLDGIEVGAEVNVQSDWNQTNNTLDDYIKNKPENTSEFNNDGEFGTDRFIEEQDVLDRLLRKQNLPTGFITGLELSIKQGDPTKAIISEGIYSITDFTDLENIQVQLVQVTTPIEFTPQYLTTNPTSYIALDINMNVIQSSSPFDNDDRRTLALIGATIHSNLTIINVVNQIKAPIVAPTNQLHDLIEAVGSLNLEGNIYGPNGNNLQINKSSGLIWGLGINSQNYLDPHRLFIPTQTALTFRYRLRDTTLLNGESSDVNLIDPDHYDNSGVKTIVPNNKFTIQRINLFQSGLTRIQYGQNIYQSLDDAKTLVQTETFQTEDNIADRAIFRAYLIIKKGVTNLTTAVTNGDADFIPVDKFGNVIGGAGVVLNFTNITTGLGYTPEDVANKATDFTTINDTLYPSVKAVDDRINTLPISQLIREEFTYLGGIQTFTLISNYTQVYSVEVQGQGALSLSQYDLILPNQIEILDELELGDYIVVIYSDSTSGTLSYYSQAQVDSFLNTKQNKLTETNFGQFMDVDLTTKITPSVNDTFVGRDSLTNEAVEFPMDYIQPKLTNPITGTGTTNMISKFTANGTIGDSQIFDNGTNVGVNTSNPNTSAQLDVQSTTRGFLPPRMTTTQRNAITTPAAGLIVYDTTDNKHYGYNGISWYTMDVDIVITNRQSASYTLTLTDRSKLVEMDVATANNLTIPLNSSVAFPIGTKVDVVQYGAGQTTFVPVSGVTIRSANNWLKMNARYGAATLTKIGTDEWYLWGNLNA